MRKSKRGIRLNGRPFQRRVNLLSGMEASLASDFSVFGDERVAFCSGNLDVFKSNVFRVFNGHPGLGINLHIFKNEILNGRLGEALHIHRLRCASHLDISQSDAVKVRHTRWAASQPRGVIGAVKHGELDGETDVVHGEIFVMDVGHKTAAINRGPDGDGGFGAFEDAVFYEHMLAAPVGFAANSDAILMFDETSVDFDIFAETGTAGLDGDVIIATVNVAMADEDILTAARVNAIGIGCVLGTNDVNIFNQHMFAVGGHEVAIWGIYERDAAHDEVFAAADLHEAGAGIEEEIARLVVSGFVHMLPPDQAAAVNGAFAGENKSSEVAPGNERHGADMKGVQGGLAGRKIFRITIVGKAITRLDAGALCKPELHISSHLEGSGEKDTGGDNERAATCLLDARNRFVEGGGIASFAITDSTKLSKGELMRRNVGLDNLHFTMGGKEQDRPDECETEDPIAAQHA